METKSFWRRSEDYAKKVDLTGAFCTKWKEREST